MPSVKISISLSGDIFLEISQMVYLME